MSSLSRTSPEHALQLVPQDPRRAAVTSEHIPSCLFPLRTPKAQAEYESLAQILWQAGQLTIDRYRVLSEYALRLDATFSQDWPKIALNEALVLGRDGHLIVHLHMSLEELVEECRHSVGLIGGQSPCFLLERSRIITLGHRPEGFASGFAGLNQPKAGNDPIVSFAGFSQEGGR